MMMGALVAHLIRCDYPVIVNLGQTITACVGNWWNASDVIDPKTGMLTMGEIVEFFTSPGGELNFGTFTELKDIASYCSIYSEQGNYWTPVETTSRLEMRKQLDRQQNMIDAMHCMFKLQNQKIEEQNQKIEALMACCFKQ